MKSYGVLASVLLFFSLMVLFVSERIMGEGTSVELVRWFGIVCFGGALALRAQLFMAAKTPAREVELRLVMAYGGVLLAMLFHLLSTDFGIDLLGLKDTAADRMEGTMSALFPAVLIVSLLAIVFMELAYRRMPVAEAIELRRVRNAAHGGVSIGLFLVFLFSMNYVANKRDVTEDVSYFKTAQPSEGTVKMLKQLGEPVEAVLFYPEVNEVLEELNPYFKALDRASGKFSVTVRDHALAPELARKHRVRDNGWVVLLKGEGEAQQAEQFEVGMDVESARSRLRKLDGSFQKAFTTLTRQRREFHLTSGHDERSASGIDDPPQMRTRILMDALERNNIRTQSLGLAQGLGNEVPESAPAVGILGPRKPFLEEEVSALIEYVKGGGRIFALVDPDADDGLEALFHAFGIKRLPGTLAYETKFLRQTGTPADRANIMSNGYTAHPTVTVLSRNSARVATIFLRGAALDRHTGDGVMEGVKVDFPLKTGDRFWRDLDGDFERDENEPLEKTNMMAVATVPNPGGDEGRLVVIGDGDLVTDQVIRNDGNIILLNDVLIWLIGQEEIVGQPTSEEDIAIEHTRDEDKLWFWGTSFGAPIPLLGAGVYSAMRRRRRRETHGATRGRTAAEDKAAPPPGKVAKDDDEASTSDEASEEEKA